MEHFRKDNNQDGTRTQTNCESCCAHNMLKMAKELYKVTGDKKYADYYETTLRNSIMGAVKIREWSQLLISFRWLPVTLRHLAMKIRPKTCSGAVPEVAWRTLRNWGIVFIFMLMIP